MRLDTTSLPPVNAVFLSPLQLFETGDSAFTRETELAMQMMVRTESVTAHVHKFLKRDSGIVWPPYYVAVIKSQIKSRGSVTLFSNKLNC